MQFFQLNLSSSSRCSALSLFLTALVNIFVCSRALVKLPPNETVPALIVFGDSIVDAGNNNNLKTLIKCNFPPYGQNFAGRMPTGRFCDGRVPSDIIAEEFGIKSTVPAYLDPTLQPQELLTGVTFASGGTGYDPLTPKSVSVISMSEQLEYFKQYIERVKAIAGEETANLIVSKGLHLVVAGSDDIANTYFTLRFRKLQYDVPAYTDFMANNAVNFLQELYKLGGRRAAVFSAPPIGCVPSQRTLAGGVSRECAENYNQAAVMFNSKLLPLLNSLNSKLPDAKFIYIDIYNPLLNLIQNPTKFGFTVSESGCCGSGNLEVAVLCNQLTPVTCPNVADHVFWDSYHPTESAYKFLILPLLKKYVNQFF